MEELITIISTYWPTILQYVMMFLAYFFVFLFKNRVNTTNTNLRTVFKENIANIKKADTELREDVFAQLLESKTSYKAAVDKLAATEMRLAKAEHAIEILLKGDTSDER